MVLQKELYKFVLVASFINSQPLPIGYLLSASITESIGVGEVHKLLGKHAASF